MPLDKQVFRTRAITAVVFAAIVLAGILINGYTFLLLLAIIGIGSFFELVKLLRNIHPRLYIASALIGFAYIFFPLLLLSDFAFPSDHAGFREQLVSYQYHFPLFIVLCLWTNDTMAYIVGSFWGKRPLSKISPKKTIEGTAGGIIATVILTIIVTYFIPDEENHWIFSLMFGLMALIISIFGTLGDLFESKLKRLAGVKDSASFMPGHGGFLDRFDSLFFAVPAVWLLWKLM